MPLIHSTCFLVFNANHLNIMLRRRLTVFFLRYTDNRDGGSLHTYYDLENTMVKTRNAPPVPGVFIEDLLTKYATENDKK